MSIDVQDQRQINDILDGGQSMRAYGAWEAAGSYDIELRKQVSSICKLCSFRLTQVGSLAHFNVFVIRGTIVPLAWLDERCKHQVIGRLGSSPC